MDSLVDAPLGPEEVGLIIPTDPIGIAAGPHSVPAESYLMGVHDCLDIIHELMGLYDNGSPEASVLVYAYKRITGELV